MLVVASLFDARVIVRHDDEIRFLRQLQRFFHLFFAGVEGRIVQDEVDGMLGHLFAEHVRVTVKILSEERVGNALFDD